MAHVHDEVMAVGLVGAAHLNGRRGRVVQGMHPQTGRVAVQFEGEEGPKRIKPQNLQVLPPLAPGRCRRASTVHRSDSTPKRQEGGQERQVPVRESEEVQEMLRGRGLGDGRVAGDCRAGRRGGHIIADCHIGNAALGQRWEHACSAAADRRRN